MSKRKHRDFEENLAFLLYFPFVAGLVLVVGIGIVTTLKYLGIIS